VLGRLISEAAGPSFARAVTRLEARPSASLRLRHRTVYQSARDQFSETLAHQAASIATPHIHRT